MEKIDLIRQRTAILNASLDSIQSRSTIEQNRTVFQNLNNLKRSIRAQGTDERSELTSPEKDQGKTALAIVRPPLETINTNTINNSQQK